MRKLLLLFLVTGALHAQYNFIDKSIPTVFFVMKFCHDIGGDIGTPQLEGLMFTSMLAEAHMLGADITLIGYWSKSICNRVFGYQRFIERTSALAYLMEKYSTQDICAIIAIQSDLPPDKIYSLYMFYRTNVDLYIGPDGELRWGGK